MLGLPPRNTAGWVFVLVLGVLVFWYFHRKRRQEEDRRG